MSSGHRARPEPRPVRARHWEARPDGRVRCLLCAHHCLIRPGGQGICQGRRNQDGTLIAANYGQVVSIAVDPIEKKPLYHFYPGREILSVAPPGCNLRCPFCQNWTISQQAAPTEYLAPEELAALLDRTPSLGVAYTYTEPLVWFEYLLDTAPLVRARGGKNVLVTNGMIEEKPLAELLPLIDAMNIDLKSIRPAFYERVVHGDLASVQRTIERARATCHVELTNLIVPTLNDAAEDIHALVDYVASLGPATVLHFSRYFPSWQLRVPPTPIATIRAACDYARTKLYYVYAGNVDGDSPDTRCPQCQAVLVTRAGFSARVVGITDHRCRSCGRPADIVL